MAKALSVDLRRRVVEAVAAGASAERQLRASRSGFPRRSAGLPVHEHAAT